MSPIWKRKNGHRQRSSVLWLAPIIKLELNYQPPGGKPLHLFPHTGWAEELIDLAEVAHTPDFLHPHRWEVMLDEFRVEGINTASGAAYVIQADSPSVTAYNLDLSVSDLLAQPALVLRRLSAHGALRQNVRLAVAGHGASSWKVFEGLNSVEQAQRMAVSQA